jgi:hypothetical protein
MDASNWIAVALACALSFTLGAALASMRFVRLERARRASFGAAAGIARVGLEALPTRSAADILSGLITIVLGGIPYVIHVLPRRASREWLARLDERFATVTAALEAADNDAPKILQLLTAHTDYMIEMLRAYDVEGVLPDNEFIETYATDGEILAAMVEVWRASNPLAAIGAEAAAETMAGTESAPLNSSPESTGGVLTTSTSS